MKGKKDGLAIMIGVGKPRGPGPHGVPPMENREGPEDDGERKMALSGAVSKVMDAFGAGDKAALETALDDWHTIMHS